MIRPLRFASLWPAAAGFVFICATGFAQTPVHLSEQEASAIGRKVWQNECAGTVAGLTSWNEGENFASLGIGHFIWYPAGAQGPFEESFPRLLGFFQSRGVKLPAWLQPVGRCPWNSRKEFVAAQSSPRMTELRNLLSITVPLQTEFLIQRLEGALPKMLEAASPADRDRVRHQFYRLLESGRGGAYVLIDYVNFKGEGTLATERYKGLGWGLLQVLENMPDTAAGPVQDFVVSAKEILTRRVRNAPPQRHEERWLPGWKNRVEGYRS